MFYGYMLLFVGRFALIFIKKLQMLDLNIIFTAVLPHICIEIAFDSINLSTRHA